jgi:hypothetical protein
MSAAADAVMITKPEVERMARYLRNSRVNRCL